MRDGAVSVNHWRELAFTAGERSLIEASAGTGKTWTIAVLYLRLLLEGETPFSPRQIVVTTFTDAAAQELRDRLRQRLQWGEALAMRQVRGELTPVDAKTPDDETWLRARWDDAAQARTDLLRLRLAQAELDLAPISTLHGLCRRVLADYPFASGSVFGPVDVIAPDELFEELLQDLWRHLQQGEETDAAQAGTYADLRKKMRVLLAPDVGLWSPQPPLTQYWPAAAADQIESLCGQAGLFASRKLALKNALTSLRAALRDPDHPISSTHVNTLLEWPVEDQVVPARHDEMLAHPLRGVAAGALRVLGYASAATEIAALERWRTLLQRWQRERLAARGQLTFDSLIQQVAQALAAPSGTLADALIEAWPAALVDEFQDTDAQQYAILDRIYRDGERRTRGHLVMIGDPKQAIYRFRGGDIHAYLAAAESAHQRLRLDTNFRSSSAYLAALNELFAAAGTALSARADSEIHYHAMQAAGRADATPYRGSDGMPFVQPLQLHYCRNVPATAGQRREQALRACARHITGLLMEGGRIGERAVAPGDIAVLLPGNADVLRLRELLQARGVPCVGAGRSSVFETAWARELQVALHAVEHHGDEGLLRAALATRFGGWRFEELASLGEGDARWTQAVRQYESLHARWRREGVLSVVLALAHAAVMRLAHVSERERALTDLRHLGELLQEEEQHREGPEQLLAWLAAQRRGEGEDSGEAAEGRQLRLESDAARVRLLTLHASKGLEFPIVFLPLMWRHVSHRGSLPVLHEPLCDRRVLGFGELPRTDVAWEEQDERFRVLYVALTRAQYACHVYVLPPERGEGRSTKPMADPDRSALDALVDRLRAAVTPDQMDAACAHVEWRNDDWAWPEVAYRDALEKPQPTLMARHEPPRALLELTYSFTALISHPARDEPAADEGEPAQADSVDVSQIDIEDAEAHPTLARLAPLRGADFGNALHAIFELRALDLPFSDQRDLVSKSLRGLQQRRDGMSNEDMVDAVSRLIDRNLSAELLPGMRLGTLPASAQRAEMAFHFTLEGFTTRALREACARHGAGGLLPPHLPAGTLRGLMTGKIDLVFEHAGRFHVLDYKSNFLGDTLDAYLPRHLGAAMDAHAYRFQALLYSVALQRYLRERLPNYSVQQHLGEAIYLFVRAVGLAPEAGIWRHRFDAALLDAVDEVLGRRLVTEGA